MSPNWRKTFQGPLSLCLLFHFLLPTNQQLHKQRDQILMNGSMAPPKTSIITLSCYCIITKCITKYNPFLYVILYICSLLSNWEIDSAPFRGNPSFPSLLNHYNAWETLYDHKSLTKVVWSRNGYLFPAAHMISPRTLRLRKFKYYPSELLKLKE